MNFSPSELTEFLKLLKGRLNSLESLNMYQKQIASLVPGSKNSAFFELSQKVKDTLKQLGQQKNQLAPWLTRWKTISDSERNRILSGKMEILIKKIEKNALAIQAYHHARYEKAGSGDVENLKISESLTDRINLFR